MNKSFWWGVALGVVGTYVYHRAMGLPGGKAAQG